MFLQRKQRGGVALVYKKRESLILFRLGSPFNLFPLNVGMSYFKSLSFDEQYHAWHI